MEDFTNNQEIIVSETATYCKACGAKVTTDSTFCANCGAKIKVEGVFCSNCGTKMDDASIFCPNCGHKKAENTQPYEPSAANTAYYAPVPKEKGKNVCSILATVFASIGIIPFLNFVFLPPAIILGIVGAATAKNKKIGPTIASGILITISLLVSFIWISELQYMF